jgi:hypothetical protein
VPSGGLVGNWNVYVLSPPGPSQGNNGDLLRLGVASVSAVSPDTGSVSTTTPITITGVGFLSGDTVVIGQGHGPGTDTLTCTSPVVVTSTQMTCTVPSGGLVGNWNVYVVSPQGPSQGNNGDLFDSTS